MNVNKPTNCAQDYVWLIAVPKRTQFIEPLFHFDERVKFSSDRHCWDTGRIIGMKFVEVEGDWVYSICIDLDSPLFELGVQEVSVKQSQLKLVLDSCSIRELLLGEQTWFPTAEAASRLSISPEQLRKLRLNGMFKSGHHYRDTSIPGSGRPCWQWHVERCTQALCVPPEKRAISQRRKTSNFF